MEKTEISGSTLYYVYKRAKIMRRITTWLEHLLLLLLFYFFYSFCLFSHTKWDKKINSINFNTNLEEAWPNNTQVGCHFKQQHHLVWKMEPDQQTYALQEISLVGNLFYIVKRNESIFIMFKSSTLFLVNYAADDKTHRRKYRASTCFFWKITCQR